MFWKNIIDYVVGNGGMFVSTLYGMHTRVPIYPYWLSATLWIPSLVNQMLKTFKIFNFCQGVPLLGTPIYSRVFDSISTTFVHSWSN